MAAFSRNPATGAPSFVEFKQDGVEGVDGPDGAIGVTISPDGKHLYAASCVDKALAVFSRNAPTGELTFVEAHKDGSGLIDGLAGAASVIVSPNGNQVYVAGTIYNTVTMSSRNSATVELTIAQIWRDGVGGVYGLDGASSIAISPDEKHLYTSGQDDDAVAVFSRSISSANLEIVKTGSLDPVTVGTNLTYVITITNNSTSTATTNVHIKDNLPPGTTLVFAEAIGGSCAGTTDITCTFSTLAAGASSTATNVVKVDLGASRMLTNNASTTSDTLDSVISNKSYKAATTGPPVPSMSVWALAALSVILPLTFSGRVRRRIEGRRSVGD